MQIAAVVALYRAEQVVVLLGGRPSDEDVTKVLIAEDCAIGTEGLTENLVAMRDKEQRGLSGTGPSLIVKRSDHRFARSGGSDNQMAVLALHLALGCHRIENLFLKWVRPQVERGQFAVLDCSPRALTTNSFSKSWQCVTVEGLELVVVPIVVEGCDYLLPEVRELVLAEFASPFEPFGKRCSGDIRGADVGAAKASRTVN